MIYSKYHHQNNPYIGQQRRSHVPFRHDKRGKKIIPEMAKRHKEHSCSLVHEEINHCDERAKQCPQRVQPMHTGYRKLPHHPTGEASVLDFSYPISFKEACNQFFINILFSHIHSVLDKRSASVCPAKDGFSPSLLPCL